MGNLGWARLDRWMRWLHLYTSLFLVPWMTVYAISAFCLNHNEWVTKGFGVGNEVGRGPEELDFTPDAAFPQVFEAQAQAILKHVALAGPHRIAGTPDTNQLTMYRFCATGMYRITWQRTAARLVVERQRPCSVYSFVNQLHFRRGYDQPYFRQLHLGHRRRYGDRFDGAVGAYRDLPVGPPASQTLVGACAWPPGVALFAALAVLLCF